jgi:hypothetical protein
MKISKFLILFLYLFITSCGVSEVIVSNLENQNNQLVNEVFFISSKEKYNVEGLVIGNVIFKEDKNLDWSLNMKQKLIEKAKESGANIIEVSKIGYNLNAHGFYLEGKLYYKENFVKNENENCEIGFIRDRFESVLGSAFTINIKANNEELGELKKEKSLSYNVQNCNENIGFEINNKELNINFNGKSKYFKIGKITSGGSNEKELQIGIGGLNIIEIEDQELGRLLLLQNI